MRARLLDQRDVRLAGLAELVTEPRRELQAAGTAADDDDAVQTIGAGLGVVRLRHACDCERPARAARSPTRVVTSGRWPQEFSRR
jgi:hypothetical protein